MNLTILQGKSSYVKFGEKDNVKWVMMKISISERFQDKVTYTNLPVSLYRVSDHLSATLRDDQIVQVIGKLKTRKNKTTGYDEVFVSAKEIYVLSEIQRKVQNNGQKNSNLSAEQNELNLEELPF